MAVSCELCCSEKIDAFGRSQGTERLLLRVRRSCGGAVAPVSACRTPSAALLLARAGRSTLGVAREDISSVFCECVCKVRHFRLSRSGTVGLARKVLGRSGCSFVVGCSAWRVWRPEASVFGSLFRLRGFTACSNKGCRFRAVGSRGMRTAGEQWKAVGSVRKIEPCNVERPQSSRQKRTKRKRRTRKKRRLSNNRCSKR